MTVRGAAMPEPLCQSGIRDAGLASFIPNTVLAGYVDVEASQAEPDSQADQQQHNYAD